jgi:hypothetical protein
MSYEELVRYRSGISSVNVAIATYMLFDSAYEYAVGNK